MATKVGSFAKSTNTGVPVTQAITGVGFQPRALILWTTGATADATFADSYYLAVGFAARSAADAITQGSRAAAAVGAAATTDASQRTAQKALTIVEWGQSLKAECDLASFDVDGFTLSWTTNNNVGYTICYMALDDSDITDAYVKAWQTGTGTGNLSVTGVGFQPDAVLHLGGSETSIPASNSGARFAIGMMTTAAQNVMYSRSNDNQGSTVSFRHARSSYCIYAALAAGGVDGYASYVSMDADGFTVNFGDAMSFSYYQIALCLKGGSYAVGTFSGSASTGDQTISGLGFAPGGVLQLSVGTALHANTSCVQQNELAIGASDGTSQYASHIQDPNSADPTESKNRTTSGQLSEIDETPSGSIDGVGNLSAITSDGYVINWSDAPGTTSAFAYFAVGGGVVASTGQPMLIRPRLLGSPLFQGRLVR